MNLKEKIRAEFKETFKSKDQVKLLVLKMIQSEIGNAEIAKRTKLAKAGEEITEEKISLNDDEVLQIISKELKKRKEAIEMYDKAGRDDLADKEKAELKVLSAYLPEQMPEGQIRELVKKAVGQSGAKDIKEIGKVMAILMPQVKGKADGALVNKIVREFLN